MNKEILQQYTPHGAKPEFFGNTATFEASVLNIKEIAADFYENKHFSLKLITATDERKTSGCFKIWYVFSLPKENLFVIPFIELKDAKEFPSLAGFLHEAINHERKIQTFFGLTPVGNPDARPIILHENWPTNVFPLRKDFDWKERPKQASGNYPFQKVDGEGIYEIPVGPIHAGIIEPGHFRFSVAGEEIMLLEARLGFVHKGSEKLFEILPMADKLRLSEKISGDSSFSHSLAFCQAVEQLSNITVPQRALYLRVIYAELERLANHFGDIGAIMIDTGFNFGGANGARLREIVMQINERLTQSRFLRNVNAIGGVIKDIDLHQAATLSKELQMLQQDFSEVIKVADGSLSLFNRLQGTGALSFEAAKNHGVVGVAAKAAGIAMDARVNHSYAAYDQLKFSNIETEQGGDVLARFRVRIKEAYALINIIQQALNSLPEGPTLSLPPAHLQKNSLAKIG